MHSFLNNLSLKDNYVCFATRCSHEKSFKSCGQIQLPKTLMLFIFCFRICLHWLFQCRSNKRRNSTSFSFQYVETYSICMCVCVCVCVCVCMLSVVSSSLSAHGLQPARLLCPWEFPGRNTGVDCCVLLQGIFLSQGLNLSPLRLLHWQAGSLLWCCWHSPGTQHLNSPVLSSQVARKSNHATRSKVDFYLLPVQVLSVRLTI